VPPPQETAVNIRRTCDPRAGYGTDQDIPTAEQPRDRNDAADHRIQHEASIVRSLVMITCPMITGHIRLRVGIGMCIAKGLMQEDVDMAVRVNDSRP
jgi:hypothetical protein